MVRYSEKRAASSNGSTQRQATATMIDVFTSGLDGGISALEWYTIASAVSHRD